MMMCIGWHDVPTSDLVYSLSVWRPCSCCIIVISVAPGEQQRRPDERDNGSGVRRRVMKPRSPLGKRGPTEKRRFLPSDEASISDFVKIPDALDRSSDGLGGGGGGGGAGAKGE